MLKIIFTILALVYIAFPRDLLPDWFIGIGWIDDLLVLYLLWRFFFRKRVLTGNSGNPGQNSRSRTQDNRRTVHPKSPYEVLGIEPGASSADIHRAYRTLANKYHPDKIAHLGPEFQALAEEKFKEIQAAYDELRVSQR